MLSEYGFGFYPSVLEVGKKGFEKKNISNFLLYFTNFYISLQLAIAQTYAYVALFF